VRDDGVGGATPGLGSGLIGLTGRVEALSGTISVTSLSGQGTTLLVDLPINRH
jgi:signal transduction histidine kinase